MGIVNEEIEHSTFNTTARVMVVEKQKGEYVDPWCICMLEIDGYGKMTPKEMRTLGRWLVAEGKRIGREYKSNGAKK